MRAGQLVVLVAESIGFEGAGGGVDDPVVRDAGGGVAALLDAAVAGTGAGGEDFHDQVRSTVDAALADDLLAFAGDVDQVRLDGSLVVQHNAKAVALWEKDPVTLLHLADERWPAVVANDGKQIDLDEKD